MLRGATRNGEVLGRDTNVKHGAEPGAIIEKADGKRAPFLVSAPMLLAHNSIRLMPVGILLSIFVGSCSSLSEL